MSVITFIYSGLKNLPKLKRSTYPADTIEAKGESSFNYSEEPKVIEENPSSIYSVGPIFYKTVGAKQRENAQNELSYLNGIARLVGVVSLGLFGGAIYNMANKGMSYSNSGAAATGLFGITLSIGRSHEANREYQLWESQLEAVCQTRKDASEDFNVLMNNNLQGSYFTPQETMHVLLKDIAAVKRQFDDAISTTDPDTIESMTVSVLKRGLLRPNTFNYAFGKERVHNPIDGTYWTPDDMKRITEKFSATSTAFSQFRAKYKAELMSIDQAQQAGNAGITATEIISSELTDRKARERLSHMKKGDILESYAAITEQAISDQTTAGVVGLVAKGGLSVFSAIQRQTAKQQAQQTILEQFTPEVDEILKDFNESHHQPSRFF